MRNRIWPVVGVALVAAGLIGMSFQAGDETWSGMHGPMMGRWHAGDAASEPPVPDAPEVEIEATEFLFRPDRPVIGSNESINLTLTNRGDLLHDLVIPDIGFHLVARPGETVSAGLRVRESGVYPFWCSVPGHAERGMVGALAVEGG